MRNAGRRWPPRLSVQYFNERVGDFDVPQPRPVIERLTEVVGAAGLRPEEVVLDIGTGVWGF